MWAIQQKEKCYGKFSQRTKIEQTFDGFLSVFLMNKKKILKNSAKNFKTKLNKRNESKETLATGVHIFYVQHKIIPFLSLQAMTAKELQKKKNITTTN